VLKECTAFQTLILPVIPLIQAVLSPAVEAATEINRDFYSNTRVARVERRSNCRRERFQETLRMTTRAVIVSLENDYRHVKTIIANLRPSAFGFQDIARALRMILLVNIDCGNDTYI